MRPLTATGFVVFLFISSGALGSQVTRDQQPPAAKIDPPSLEFGNQVAKRVSKPQRITVTNIGGKRLYVNSIVISGDHHQDFSVLRDMCTGATIAPGKSCVIDVVFTPARNERRKASIVLTDNALDSPQTIPVAGNGINSADVPPSSGLSL